MECDAADLSQACLQQDRGPQFIAVMVPLLVLTSLAVVLRCYTRIFITKGFKADDWFIVISQIIFFITGAFIFTGVHYGLGRHNAAVAQGDEIEALKYQTLASLAYIANMATIKLSVAVLLHRIAVERAYVWILRISMVCLTNWTLGIFFFLLFQCQPIQFQWDFTIPNGYCPSGDAVVAAGYSFSVLCIVTDWLYALLPIPMIWKVNMSIQAKLSVILILSLGIFASVANLIRTKYLIEIGEYSDLLYNSTDALIWTLIEPAIAIIAASMIALRPLLRLLKIGGFGSRQVDDRGGADGGIGGGGLALNLHQPLEAGDAKRLDSDGVTSYSGLEVSSCETERTVRTQASQTTSRSQDLDSEERGTPLTRIWADHGSEESILPGLRTLGRDCGHDIRMTSR